MSTLNKATGAWRKNTSALEKFNQVILHSHGFSNTISPFTILPQKEEDEYEARGVIEATMPVVSAPFMIRCINWVKSWCLNPITTFTVTCMGSGRGSCQFSTWLVKVDYCTGRVLKMILIHTTGTDTGFPKSGEPKFDDMRAELSEHVCYNPDFFLLWGSAYYVAPKSLKFEDEGRFHSESMNNLPNGGQFSGVLPFMDLFLDTPTLALRTLNTPTGEFKPGWGAGLEFPHGYTTEVYGNLGSGAFNLVDAKTGKALVTCEVSSDTPEESAKMVCEKLENYYQ
jgi:hypothetical protein